MSRLDKAGAHRRAQRVRDGVAAIDDVIDTLIEIQERQDWIALGYGSYGEYCEGEFGPAKLKLTAEQRGRVVAVLASSGMSKRRVALALGVSEGTVRNDVKRSKGAQNYALPNAEPQVNDDETAADGANASADGGTRGPSAPTTPPAAGPDEQHEPTGPAVTPTDHRGTADPGDTDGAARPSAPSAPPVVPGADGQASEAGAERLPSVPPPADEADQGQASEGVPAPVPPHLFADPPAFLKWFADLFEQVDVDAVGPLLVGDDFELLGDSLERIRTVIDQLADWRTRTQR